MFPDLGCIGRELFILRERLNKALANANEDEPIALLFIDLDRFKEVNDTLGHGAGDDLLCEVAERVKRSVRFTDYVARPDSAPATDAFPAGGVVSRLGGDEFTVLLTEISDPTDAADVAQRVLDELTQPLRVGGYELYTTASIGIAVYPNDGEDPETLLRNADTAMYNAKTRRRNTFQFYTEEMNVSAARKLHLASRLRHAFGRGQLELYYQPLRATVSGRVTGAEVLLTGRTLAASRASSRRRSSSRSRRRRG